MPCRLALCLHLAHGARRGLELGLAGDAERPCDNGKNSILPGRTSIFPEDRQPSAKVLPLPGSAKIFWEGPAASRKGRDLPRSAGIFREAPGFPHENVDFTAI